MKPILTVAGVLQSDVDMSFKMKEIFVKMKAMQN
jgi:hypothetical protein